MEFQPKKRKLAGLAIATMVTSGGILVPRPAKSDPVIIGAFIAMFGSLVAAVMNIANVNKQAEESARIAKNAWRIDRVNAMINTLNASQQLALLQNHDFVQMMISGNLDGIGTVLEIQDGNIIVARNKAGGKITSDEADFNRNVILPSRDSVAIPVEYYQPIEFNRDKDSLVAYLAENNNKKQRMSESAFASKYELSQTRLYSNSRYPNKGNADFKMVVALNKDLARGRNAPVEIFRVPARV